MPRKNVEVYIKVVMPLDTRNLGFYGNLDVQRGDASEEYLFKYMAATEIDGVNKGRMSYAEFFEGVDGDMELVKVRIADADRR